LLFSLRCLLALSYSFLWEFEGSGDFGDALALAARVDDGDVDSRGPVYDGTVLALLDEDVVALHCAGGAV
jgi:hypothetical protein